LDGTLRILDYKTGKVAASQLHIGDFEKVTQAYKYTKALQVMLYAFLYSSQNKTVFENKVQAGIVSFKNMKSGFISMNFSKTRTKDVELTEVRVQEFMEVVKQTLFEIFDPKTPFVETKNKP
jgi:ATP-dependent helicase/nuclease subunit B